MSLDSKTPLPPLVRKHSFTALKTLQVGESTTFPLSAFDSLSPAINRRQRLDGTKFARRLEGDFIRVWRIA